MNENASNKPVAYLGPEGTYTHTALLKFFGPSQKSAPKAEIHEVFTSVESGASEFGLVPVENSTEGPISLTLDCISSGEFSVYGEVMLRIQHCLMAPSSLDFNSIDKIVAHQQSLGQCRQWLSKSCSEIELVAVSSNAEAAKISAKRSGVAAIAGKTAADLYGLNILARNIEDRPDNTTRFWVIGRRQKSTADGVSVSNWTGKDKTSMVISAKNKPGTLFQALEPFHRFNVNLIKLESRPSRKTAWSYSFFIDLDGHLEDQNVKSALDVLHQKAIDITILGSYSVAENDS